MEEKNIWQGRPHQISNLTSFILGFLFCWLLIPAYLAIKNYLVTRFTNFEVTDQRIIVQKGIFSRRTEELELFRVKDIRLDEPFFLRMFNLSNIVLVTSDLSHPGLTIPAIANGKQIREEVRKAVDIRRDLKRVREID